MTTVYKYVKALGGFLLVSISTLVVLEIALGMLDPLGMAFYAKVDWLNQFLGRANGSFSLSPGQYDMDGWVVSMNQDATRLVPDSGTGCTLLFVGDSVTWGWGVNDEQTFANLIARELGVKAINAGVYRYSSENVAASLQFFKDYELAVYLIFPNDHHRTWSTTQSIQPFGEYRFPGFGILHQSTPALVWYGLYFTTQSTHAESTPYMERFEADMQRITAHDNVLVFAFDDPLTTAVSERYEVNVIDWYTGRISPVDPHPDPDGHQHIADAMLPYLRDRMTSACV